MKNKLLISGIRTYAFHGCIASEATVGGLYRTDVGIETDFSAAAAHDNLSETVDYSRVAAIVQREMGIRSRLIENVAWRIYHAIRAEFPALEKITVRVSKLSPPVEGAADAATVEIGD